MVISAEISLGDSVDDHMARVTENNKIKFIIQDGVFILKVYAPCRRARFIKNRAIIFHSLSAEIFQYQNTFFQFEIIINVLVSSFRFI